MINDCIFMIFFHLIYFLCMYLPVWLTLFLSSMTSDTNIGAICFLAMINVKFYSILYWSLRSRNCLLKISFSIFLPRATWGQGWGCINLLAGVFIIVKFRLLCFLILLPERLSDIHLYSSILHSHQERDFASILKVNQWSGVIRWRNGKSSAQDKIQDADDMYVGYIV